MTAYDTTFSVEDGLMVVRLAGEFPMEMLAGKQSLFEPLATACVAQGCRRALVDARELQVNLGTLGLLRAGDDAALLQGMDVRVALVARADMIDPFFETVVYNRGGNVRVFQDESEARAWLAEQ